MICDWLWCLIDRGLPANIQLDVDGDRESERIYTLFSSYMSKLVKMQGGSEMLPSHSLVASEVKGVGDVT